MGLLVASLWPLSGCAQPDAYVVIAVRDEDGSAVTNVEVGVGTFVRRIPGPEAGFAETAQVEARTDTNGFARLTIPSRRGDLYIGMQPTDGFYYDRGIELRMTNAVGGRWEPWGQTNVLVVRRIVNPIPMYVKRIEARDLVVPAFGVPLGFDLMVGDWVSPHGVGKQSDFVFNLERKLGNWTEARIREFDARLSLTFANPGDGIQKISIPAYSPPRGSVFRMPRHAPPNGYDSRADWHLSYDSRGTVGETSDADCYFFRVRSKADSQGSIESALYGKIQGPVPFGVFTDCCFIKMVYYLNPTPNDLNMEFDPKRNLIKAASTRQVDDP
jgi:hypothetical protein